VGSTNGRDLGWWLVLFLPALLAGAAMYATAFAVAPPGMVFSGFLLNSSDAWGYRAFARLFAGNGFLIDNPFAAAPHPPAFFNLAWFTLGKVMSLTGLSFLALYYALGILSAGLMYWVILRFSREFAGDGAAGRFAYLLAGVGGGAGWVLTLISKELAIRLRPMDLFHQEGYPLQAALFVPHFALSIALVGAIMLAFRRGVSTGRLSWSWGAGMLTLLLGFFHPYHLVTVGVVAAAWVGLEQALDRRRFHRGWIGVGLLALAMLPPALYYGWLFRQPNWAIWAEKNIVLTGSPWGAAIGLGPLLLLAMAGVWRQGWLRLDVKRRFLAVWALIGFGLLFSHRIIGFEAKLVEGLVLPLAALGAPAIFGRDGAVSRRRWLAAGTVLLLLLPSSVMLAVGSQAVARGGDETLFPVDWVQGTLLTRGEMASLEFISRGLSSADLIISPLYMGRIIPAMADARVYVSSPSATPDFAKRIEVTGRFYLETKTPPERQAMLKQNGITHVWYGGNTDSTLKPWTEPYLEPVFNSDEVSVWRVR
jgi:hypothetical protein